MLDMVVGGANHQNCKEIFLLIDVTVPDTTTVGRKKLRPISKHTSSIIQSIIYRKLRELSQTNLDVIVN